MCPKLWLREAAWKLELDPGAPRIVGGDAVQ